MPVWMCHGVVLHVVDIRYGPAEQVLAICEEQVVLLLNVQREGRYGNNS